MFLSFIVKYFIFIAESAIVLWRKKADPETARSLLDDRVPNEEHWVSWKVLRGHLEDVYDLSWSPDSTGIVSGSVDNTAILWDVKTGRSTHIFSDYKGFVQGVSWDPQGKNIVTLSSDRFEYFFFILGFCFYAFFLNYVNMLFFSDKFDWLT